MECLWHHKERRRRRRRNIIPSAFREHATRARIQQTCYYYYIASNGAPLSKQASQRQTRKGKNFSAKHQQRVAGKQGSEKGLLLPTTTTYVLYLFTYSFNVQNWIQLEVSDLFLAVGALWTMLSFVWGSWVFLVMGIDFERMGALEMNVCLPFCWNMEGRGKCEC